MMKTSDKIKDELEDAENSEFVQETLETHRAAAGVGEVLLPFRHEVRANAIAHWASALGVEQDESPRESPIIDILAQALPGIIESLGKKDYSPIDFPPNGKIPTPICPLPYLSDMLHAHIGFIEKQPTELNKFVGCLAAAIHRANAAIAKCPPPASEGSTFASAESPIKPDVSVPSNDVPLKTEE